MKIEHLNATFQPAKIGHPHGLQVTYLKDNSTRNIFVYHEDGKVGAGCLVGAGSWGAPPRMATWSRRGPGRGADLEVLWRRVTGWGHVHSVLRGRPPSSHQALCRVRVPGAPSQPLGVCPFVTGGPSSL